MIKFYSKYFFMILWNIYTRNHFKIKNKYFYNKYKSFFLRLKKLKIKILFLKPYHYTDLYQSSLQLKNKDKKIILSTRYRLGPIGLFLNFFTDVILVNNNEHLKIGKNIYFNKYKKKSDNYKYIYKQYLRSKVLKNINLSSYEMIISLKDDISKDYIKKNSNIVWAKMFEDHSDASYKKNAYLESELYDLTLNLTQGYTPYSLFRSSNNIDFPYSFGNSSFLKQMNFSTKKKIDIVCEIFQPEEINTFLNSNGFKNFVRLDGSLEVKKYIKLLSSSKIFFSPIYGVTNPRWGNSITEAALCQCLIVGNPYSYWNSLLIHDDLVCKSFSESLSILNTLLNDGRLFNYYLDLQNKKLNFINYYQPIIQIINKIKKIKNYKKISKKLLHLNKI
jgi:hypothetical protein